MIKRKIISRRAEGVEVTGFWYNHNIHPYQEYKARRDTLVEYAKAHPEWCISIQSHKYMHIP